MELHHAKRNIKLYYLFKLFFESLFWGAILIIFIQRVAGMSLSEIYLMEAVCVLLVVLLEVPSGALADILGRKRVIIIGVALLFFDHLLYALAINPTMIWVGNMFWAVGFSLISGADTSLLFDSLKVLDQEDRYKTIEGRARGYRFMITAGACLLGGYLAEVNLRLPMFLDLPFLLVPLVVACFFVEPPYTKLGRYKLASHWNIMKVSVLFVANHKQVKWIIGFALLVGVVSKLWFFTYNPYFELVGLPLHQFGWIFFLLNLVASLSSFHAHRVANKLGDFASLVMIVLLLAVPIWLMGVLIVPIAAYLVLSQNLVRGYFVPFIGHLLHDRLDSENRATVMSIQSAMVSIGQFVMLGGFGLVLGYFTLTSSLQLLALFTLVFGSILIVVYPRIFPKKE